MPFSNLVLFISGHTLRFFLDNFIWSYLKSKGYFVLFFFCILFFYDVKYYYKLVDYFFWLTLWIRLGKSLWNFVQAAQKIQTDTSVHRSLNLICSAQTLRKTKMTTWEFWSLGFDSSVPWWLLKSSSESKHSEACEKRLYCLITQGIVWEDCFERPSVNLNPGSKYLKLLRCSQIGAPSVCVWRGGQGGFVCES